jgi:hypothetical protein
MIGFLMIEDGHDSIREIASALQYILSFITGKANMPLKIKYLLAASATHYAHTIFSFLLLAKCTPLTHSLGSVVKRLLTIVYSMLVFQINFVPLNIAGIIISNFGVFWYAIEKSKMRKIDVMDSLSYHNGPLPKTTLVAIVFISLLYTMRVTNNESQPFSCTYEQESDYIKDVQALFPGSSNLILIGMFI